MKKNINDYKRTKTAIEVNSIEEFDKIKKLLGHTKQKGERCFKENKNYISCYSDDYCDKQYWINAGFTLYKASDFLEEVIPEYVEYIDTKYKGQIVKVEEWTNHNFCCIRFENGQREQPFKDLVKLSTKEAYEAQNKPKQLTVSDLIEGEIYKTNYKEQGDYIPSIIKKQTKLQTITIESPIHLELNLTKIKSKQIQTIKI